MSSSTVERSPTPVIVLSGDIDASTTRTIAERICSELDAGSGTVVVDCSAVAFVDSRGLGMIARVQRRFNDADRALVWRGFNHHVLKTLRLVGLYESLSVEL
jgi:anti-sigma B factor antagonist